MAKIIAILFIIYGGVSVIGVALSVTMCRVAARHDRQFEDMHDDRDSQS